jgi:hypothetical protein
MVVYRPDVDIIAQIKIDTFHDSRSVVAPSTLLLFLLRRIRPACRDNMHKGFS